MEPISVPLWANILSMVVGLAIIVAMAKWIAHREQRTNGTKTKSKG